jgi:hypothetical protein
LNKRIRFKINTPKVIHENFDDEVVIINLDTGNYYSFDRIGAGVWSLLEAGASFAEVIQRAVERYQGDRAEIENLLQSFIKELQKEELIIALDTPEDMIPDCVVAQGIVAPGTEKPVFKAPVMQKFTDMQDLLLLDPIHEVDEKGWPSVKRDPF